jgi:hypothetical protein
MTSKEPAGIDLDGKCLCVMLQTFVSPIGWSSNEIYQACWRNLIAAGENCLNQSSSSSSLVRAPLNTWSVVSNDWTKCYGTNPAIKRPKIYDPILVLRITDSF